MSRSTFQKKAGLIFALAAFVLGVTAVTALGWANEENQGKEHGKKETPPTVTIPTPAPPQQVPTTPAPTPAPPAVAPAPQAAPAPVEQVKAKRAPKRKGAERKQQQNAPEQAEVTPAAQTTLAPAVERKQLARTGLDPVLMALLGALCLAGGGLLFRRAVAR
jgi:outer membrane biosynthesis protein TonB